MKSVEIECPQDRMDAADIDIIAARLTDEFRTIDMEWSTRHREHHIRYIVANKYRYWRISQIRSIIVFINTGEWWIVAEDPTYDSKYRDVGPFESLNEALTVAVELDEDA